MDGQTDGQTLIVTFRAALQCKCTTDKKKRKVFLVGITAPILNSFTTYTKLFMSKIDPVQARR